MPADAETPLRPLRDDPNLSFVAALRAMADRAEREAPDGALPVARLIDQLDERAFGILILLLSLPCLVPALPGAQIIAVPIFLLAVQMLAGRDEPWLPGWFLRLDVKTTWLVAMARFAERRLAWAERAARPRLVFLAHGAAEKAVAAVLVVAALTIMLPVTNTIPSLGVTLIALGLIARDGVFILAGAAVAFAWIAVVAVVIVSLAVGADFALRLAREHAPWLASLVGG
ncbi:MAG: exopolysaccharide biosynthesis protein [Alphaproteobacteria bacterium]|nr:exopolysaccharide biosynthesis protein [Alphaproteobacteria bacterium]